MRFNRPWGIPVRLGMREISRLAQAGKPQLRNPETEDHEENDGTGQGDDHAGHAPELEVEQQDQAGERDQRS